MKLIFLGTSAGSPTKSRNVTSIALQWVQQGQLWLFDCGEGTQHQFQRAPISLSKLGRLFISHMHGDHLFGLPGLLASRSASQSAEGPLTIYGPADVGEFLRTSLTLSHSKIKYQYQTVVLEEGVVWEDEFSKVECRLLNHGIPSYGFAVTERQQPGEFLPERAAAFGVTAGPEYGKLKSGDDIELADGTIVHSEDVVGPPKRGRKVVICGDTGVTDAVVELATSADVLVHEATFMKDQTERAIQVGHSTAAQAAEAARRAEVKLLILTHFSPRYEQEKANLLPGLLSEATEIFPNTILAEDLFVHEVPAH